jgi:Ni/Fe-hydrogenase subunit HybB-like protein
MNPLPTDNYSELLSQVIGFVYPNEVEVQWSILIVIYPYLTGLVAGAFILASLMKIFKVKEIQPTYRLALVTALAFLIVAPMPLLLHLAQPTRFYEIMITPNPTSAMAMFGFVYSWYLMAVLLIEIWFEWRVDLITLGQTSKGPVKWMYKVLSLFSTDTSPQAVDFDHKAIQVITIIGIPSAFLLHGYVGFIFGSVKANPWWSSVLMPIAFLMSAIVSGIALMIVVYMVLQGMRKQAIDMPCVEKISSYLFYAVIVDIALEALDFIHRLYQSEESIKILGHLITQKLFMSLIVMQILLGMVVPVAILAVTKARKFSDELRKLLYFTSAVLILLGVLAMRWNVVIGGQLFSKSFRGLMTYKMEVFGIEGLATALVLLILPFIILAVLMKVLPTKTVVEPEVPAHA